MALAEYQQKRSFDQTPEPHGKPGKGRGPLRFVVQKHAASRLHYDFRLEMDGVLKSWAVPKGPSLNPGDKHLAMMVEDHPYDYRTFEGVIPKGNYGGGTVMVWDEGTYYPGYADHDGKFHKTGKNRAEQEKELQRQLHDGHLTFIIEGKKLGGEFALIKMKDADEENAWLLIKKNDKFADPDRDVTADDSSAATGRTMDQIAAQADERNQALNRDIQTSVNQSLVSILSSAPQAPMPHSVKPMLATLAGAPFDDPDWVYEIKWDGYRAMAEVEHDRVKLYSRNLQPFEIKFAPIAQSLRQLGHAAVLDGEVVVVDLQGRSRFQLLQDYQRTHKGTLVYYVFDILHLDGHDLTPLPLVQRKTMLQQILPNLPNIRFSEHIQQQGKQFFELARQRGLEGIMAKQASGQYLPGKRAQQWLKIKTHQRQEAVIGGYTQPRGSRQYFGALVLGVYEGDDLVYIGHTGGGFDDAKLKNIHQKLQQLEIDVCPFKVKPKTNAPARWVKPQLVCEVEFSEWTGDGSMRHPIFIGLRHDKNPKEVVREMPLSNSGPGDRSSKLGAKNGSVAQSTNPEPRTLTTTADQEVTIGRHKLKLTHLNKIYWPDDGYIKGELLNYYRDIAATMMPYLKDRPCSLNRHPGGITSSGFYQKDVENHPSWIKTQVIRSDTEERDIHYLVCRDEASLIYMANLGCIEINPWSSRTQHLDQPDWCVIDLDPEDIGFDEVIKVARQVHKTLEGFNVPSYPKTSGATGIHVYIPLGARYDYDQTKDFAHIIVQLVNAALPDITSIVRQPAKRQKRVYLDYLQNRRGQTLAAPYSVRPRPGAPVSTPLKWEEVKSGLHPSQFTIKTIWKRLDQVGDLWRPVIGQGIDMAKVLANIENCG